MSNTNQNQQNQTTEQDNALDLQSMMFEQMKRLSNPDLNLEAEIKRAQALSSAGTVIINAEKVKIDRKRLNLQEQKTANSNDKQLTNGA